MDPGPTRFRNSLCPIHRGLIAMSGYLETLSLRYGKTSVDD
jgi:hypothetical protein